MLQVAKAARCTFGSTCCPRASRCLLLVLARCPGPGLSRLVRSPDRPDPCPCPVVPDVGAGLALVLVGSGSVRGTEPCADDSVGCCTPSGRSRSLQGDSELGLEGKLFAFGRVPLYRA